MVKQSDKPVPVPTALTSKVHTAICAAVRKGLPLKHAAASAHVGITSVKDWLAAGREHPGTRQAALVADIEAAKAELIEECMEVIGSAVTPGEFGVTDWKARAWILERRFHHDFSQRQEQHITVSSEEGSPQFNIKPRRHTVPSVELDTDRMKGKGNTGANGEKGA